MTDHPQRIPRCISLVIAGTFMAAAIAPLLFPALRASASSFVVTTESDVVDPDDDALSLREAVLAANEAGAGPHTITFDLGRAPHTISLDGGGALLIESHIVIDAGDTEITIDASPSANSIFSVTGHLELSGTNLTLTGASGAAAIRAHHRLTLSGVTISDNTAGGIRVDGALVTLTGVTITNNTAPEGGGIRIDQGTVTLTESTVSGNTATLASDSPDAGGGGIWVLGGAVTLIDSAVTDNTAARGGGILAAGGNGIGFPSASITVSNSTISNNEANHPGGGGRRDLRVLGRDPGHHGRDHFGEHGRRRRRTCA